MRRKLVTSAVIVVSAVSTNAFAAATDDVPEGGLVLVIAKYACEDRVLSAIPGRGSSLYGAAVAKQKTIFDRRFGKGVFEYTTGLGYSKASTVRHDPAVAGVTSTMSNDDFADIVEKICSKAVSSDTEFQRRYPDPFHTGSAPTTPKSSANVTRPTPTPPPDVATMKPAQVPDL